MTRRDEIRKRAEAATPGPWIDGLYFSIRDPNPVQVQPVRAGHFSTGKLICGIRHPDNPENQANVQFIANARKDVPYLLGEIERLREALRTAETYLVERGIEEKGTVGRTVVLPAIRATLKEE